MMLCPTNDQPLNEKPTMWVARAQGTSLAGLIESEHPFAHLTQDSGHQVSSRIARGLGSLKNGP
jgi:hypothetical protein